MKSIGGKWVFSRCVLPKIIPGCEPKTHVPQETGDEGEIWSAKFHSQAE